MARGTKNKKIEQTEAQTVLDAVKIMEPTKVVNEIGNLQVSLQGTLAGLSATITSKLQQVEQLDQAISLKESRLQELYGIEKEVVTLDEMKATKEDEIKKWGKEQDERDNRWQEEETERFKLWKRAEEDHKYNTEVANKKMTDDFNASLNKKLREESVRAELLQKSWNDRETALKAKEQEFADLKTQVVGFDQRLKTEVAKAEAILSNFMKKNFEHEAALLRKDAELERGLASIKISAMNDQIGHLEEQVKQAQSQLVMARQDAKDVATQALHSASERGISEALKGVVNSRGNEPTSKVK